MELQWLIEFVSLQEEIYGDNPEEVLQDAVLEEEEIEPHGEVSVESMIDNIDDVNKHDDMDFDDEELDFLNNEAADHGKQSKKTETKIENLLIHWFKTIEDQPWWKTSHATHSTSSCQLQSW